MPRFKLALAVFLTGLMCWIPVFQPIAAYAEASGAIETIAEGGVSDESATEGEASADASGDQSVGNGGSQSASDDQSSVSSATASNTTDSVADAASAGSETQMFDTSSEASIADPASEKPSSDASMANSWRYQNGVFVGGEENTDAPKVLDLDNSRASSVWGIDVSYGNGRIDWAQVKDSGCSFAIIRCGYGWGGDDGQYLRNVQECKKYGIKFGIYLYSYAWDATSAQWEANWTIEQLKTAGVMPGDLSLPVYYDLENMKDGRPAGVDDNNQYRFIDQSQFAPMASTFCNALNAAGYTPGVYANLNWWNSFLTDSVFNNWDRWVAQYNYECDYGGSYSIWQHTSSGKVAGISTNVDMNYYYGNLLGGIGAAGNQHVGYRAHVARQGWQDYRADGSLSGTTGQGLSMEALNIQLYNQECDGGIEARSHVANVGWQDWAAGSTGTTGQGSQLEAIQLRLTGEMANQYDIYYAVHSAEFGWLAWAKNGEKAGSQGYGRGVQAIKVVLVKKGQSAPEAIAGSMPQSFYKPDMTFSYSAHVSNIGWMSSVSSNGVAGTTGQSRAMEAVSLNLKNAEEGYGIQASAHVTNIGWMDWTFGVAGTTDQSRTLQAIKIKLSDAMAQQYDIYYRVHSSNMGWLGWAKNGEPAGTEGYDRAVEAIQIQLVEKDDAPSLPSGSYADAHYVKPMSITYGAHVSNIGWMPRVEDGVVAGTTGQSRQVEALSVAIDRPEYSGSVEINAHVSDVGWQGYRTGTVGTTGQSRSIQAIQMKLTGELAEHYEVWYRVHSSNYGWLAWTHDGETAGTTGLGLAVEAVQIELVEKGSAAFDSTGTASIEAPQTSLSAHVSEVGWTAPVGPGGIAAAGNNVEAMKLTVSDSISGGVAYAAYVQDLGWMPEVENGAAAGTTGRSKHVEAVKVRLTGDLNKYFDVWYRVQLAGTAWMGWAKNGEFAGTTGSNRSITGIQVKVTYKGAPVPGASSLPAFSTQLPQLYSEAGWMGRHIVDVARSTPSPGGGLCALWISQVFDRAGLGYESADARDFYWNDCVSSNLNDLKVGMILATPSHSHTYLGGIYGHVAVYIGDGMVMDNVGTVRIIGLDWWISYYTNPYTVKWGYYNRRPF